MLFKEIIAVISEIYRKSSNVLCNENAVFLSVKVLKTKRNLLYIRNQFVPRSKRFPPRL